MHETVQPFRRCRCSYEGHFFQFYFNLPYANDKNIDFLVVNMRAEHLPFLKLGSSVCAPATCFNEHGQIRYSREHFGDDWETAVMVGRVRRKHKSHVVVCWDDNILRHANFDDIELHGNDLLAAETRLKHRNTANFPNYVGGSTGKVNDTSRILSRATSFDSITNSDSDAPLNRLNTSNKLWYFSAPFWVTFFYSTVLLRVQYGTSYYTVKNISRCYDIRPMKTFY